MWATAMARRRRMESSCAVESAPSSPVASGAASSKTLSMSDGLSIAEKFTANVYEYIILYVDTQDTGPAYIHTATTL
jgi:hypothetical protein